MPWFFATQEQLAERRARKVEKAQDRVIRAEAKYYADLIPKVLANCGIDHWLAKSDRPTLIEEKLLDIHARLKVRILEVRYNNHAIYLWIDSRQLPYHSRLPDLYEDGVLETLSDACGRQVAWRSEPGKGSWFVVWRNGAVNAIPALFRYNEAVEQTPKNAPPLLYIAGVSENNRLIKVDLAALPHLLVAGSTFTGKSVHLNNLLCQIIARNTPETVQMLMIDLKGGSEFAYYESLPHLWHPIVTEPADVPAALNGYHEEMKRRMELFSRRGVKTLEGWNDQFPDEKLPYLLLVFDELSLIMTHVDRKMVKDATAALSAIMATSRSTGGHAVLCTQRPSTDVIPAWIKANANGRICFAVPSNTDSIVVIDNGMASKINTDIPGRAILSQGPKLIELQSPFISDNQIRNLVRQAAMGALESRVERGEITLQDILNEAVDNFGGNLHADKLVHSFNGQISRSAVRRMIQSLNGGIYLVHDREYRIKRSRGIHGGTQLIPLAPEPERPRSAVEMARAQARSSHNWLKAGASAEIRRLEPGG